MSKEIYKPPRRKPNYFYTIVSVAAVLLLLQSRQLTRVLKEQVDNIVELAPASGDTARLALELGLAGGKQLILVNDEWVYKAVGDPDHVKGPCPHEWGWRYPLGPLDGSYLPITENSVTTEQCSEYI